MEITDGETHDCQAQANSLLHFALEQSLRQYVYRGTNKEQQYIGCHSHLQWQTHLTQQVIINETPKCDHNIIQIETNLKTTEAQENLPQIKHCSTQSGTCFHRCNYWRNTKDYNQPKFEKNVLLKKSSRETEKRQKGYDEKQNKII